MSARHALVRFHKEVCQRIATYCHYALFMEHHIGGIGVNRILYLLAIHYKPVLVHLWLNRFGS